MRTLTRALAMLALGVPAPAARLSRRVTGGGNVTNVLALASQIVFASVPFAFLIGRRPRAGLDRRW